MTALLMSPVGSVVRKARIWALSREAERLLNRTSRVLLVQRTEQMRRVVVHARTAGLA